MPQSKSPKGPAAADDDASSPVASPSPSRRRQRVDSESILPVASIKPQPKRFKLGPDDLMPPATQRATTATASGKAKPTMPEVIDLTRRTSLQPFTGARKLVIKNVRSRPRDQQLDEYYRRTWDELEAALQSILAGTPLDVPLERVYTGVEDMCRNGLERKLYDMLKQKCQEHLHSTVLEDLKEARNRLGEQDVLRSVLRAWKTWNSQTILIRSTFTYLDRAFLLRQNKLHQINDLAISLFRKMLLPKSGQQYIPTSMGATSISNIVAQIDYDRKADGRFEAALTRESIMMFHVIDSYTSALEPVILEHSKAYFESFGEERNASSLRDYIHATQKLLYREDLRCNALNLDPSTKRSILDCARQILIDNYSSKLLDGGSLGKLLDDMDIVSLKALYELLKVSGKQASLNAPFCDYIRQRGGAIIGDTSRDDEMILRLLEFRKALDLIVRDAFEKDDAFHKGLRDAFGKFMNDNKVATVWKIGRDKVAEMIAKYIDMLLRGGIKAIPKSLLSDARERADAERKGQASSADEDAELDRQLDQALELFRHLGTKDTFEAFYKRDLARRLLMERSASQDAERNMLAKFRGECGSNFTHNLEQMFKDQELARDEMAAYRQTMAKRREDEMEDAADGKSQGASSSPIDLSVMILSAAAWPSYPNVELRLPAEVAREIEHFDKHYRAKHTGRRLTWKHALTHCVLKARFPRGVKELFVSAFQAAVLLLFNDLADDAPLSYAEIAAMTGLEGGELERTLQSLACGKVRVLTKHPKGKDVAKTDTFTVNKTFTDPKIRVKINQIQLKETREETRATHERVAQDRRFETQAAIVRVMKSRKTMGHAELVAEVIGLTRSRGSVEAADIKKEIETLIEKDYLDRGDDGTYEYIA